MTNRLVRIIDPTFSAKDAVVLRFNKRDAQIARDWRDSGTNDKPIDAASLAQT